MARRSTPRPAGRDAAVRGAAGRLRPLPLSRVYRLLEPGPVVLVTTAHRGHANVMAMSWHTMIEFEPPLVACVVSRANFSRRALVATGECVIAIPDRRLAGKVVAAGNVSGRDCEKFEVIGLTPVPSTRVGAPRIVECWANLECRVRDTALAARYDLFVLEVVAAWVRPGRGSPTTIHHRGRGVFVPDGKAFRLPSAKP